MKRILTLLLMIAMTLQPVIISAEDTEADTLSKDVYLIESLGIMGGLSESLSEGISRAEFVSLALKMAKIDLLEVSEEPKITDVTMGHAYAGEICTALEFGIITADKNGAFRPDDYISVEDATVILMNAMGYRLDDSSLYERVARTMNLTDDLTYGRSDILTRRNAAVMIYNALNAPEVNVTSGDIKLDLSEGKTFLQKKWEVYFVKGVVDTTGIATVTERNVVANKAYIDDVLYYTDAFSLDDMLGCTIKAYYYDIDDERSIVYAYTTAGNNIVKITDDLDSFSNNIFTFKNDRKKTTYKIGRQTNVLWNNRVLDGSEFAEKLNSQSAEFTLIDNNSDSVYDYVIVKDAIVCVPKVLDSDRLILGGDGMEDVELEDYASYSIRDIDGEEIDFSDIKTTYVVLVYDSGDVNTCLELVVIKNPMSAEVTAIEADDNRLTIFGGEEYKVAANSAYAMSKFEINVTYSLYLDKSNRIVYAKVEKRSGFSPIYIMRIMQDEEEQTIIRALSIDGEIVRYNVAKKVNVRLKDGTLKSMTEKEIFTAFDDNTGRLVRQLVLAKLNANYEINTIYTVSDNSNQLFYDPHPDDHNAYRWMASQYSFENLIQLKASTKVFFVPYPSLDNIDDEFYYVGDVGLFRNDTAYQSSSYYSLTGYGFKPVTMQPGSMESDYIVIECPENAVFSAGSSCYGIVTKVSDVYSEEYEESCKKVVVLNMSGVEQTFYYFPSAGGSLVGRGDIVQIQYSTSKIYDRDIYMYYDYSKDEWSWITNFDNTIGWRYYAGFRVTRGKVLQTENSIAKCEAMTTKNNYQNEYIKYNTAQIVRFDGTSYSIIDGSNIKPGMEFFAMLSGGGAKMFVLYEDLPR